MATTVTRTPEGKIQIVETFQTESVSAAELSATEIVDRVNQAQVSVDAKSQLTGVNMTDAEILDSARTHPGPDKDRIIRSRYDEKAEHAVAVLRKEQTDAKLEAAKAADVDTAEEIRLAQVAAARP